jgi:septal ring factor EnvC (AmiA/AmiB activator)
VKNTAKINELVEEKGLLRHYRSEIASLKAELAKALANEKTLTRDVGMKGEQEEKKRIEQDTATEAMAKRMAELERTRTSLESKISALTKLILRGGFANGHAEEEEEREAETQNGNGHTPDPGTPTRSRAQSISASPARVGQLQALIDQLHNELKLKDETQSHMRTQMDTLHQNLADAKKQIVQLQEEAIQRQKGDEWLILQSAHKEERTRAAIYNSADAKYRKEMGVLEAARACLELDVKVVEKERALLAAHMRVKDLRIAELEVEVHDLRVRNETLEREQRKRMLITTSPR